MHSPDSAAAAVHKRQPSTDTRGFHNDPPVVIEGVPYRKIKAKGIGGTAKVSFSANFIYLPIIFFIYLPNFICFFEDFTPFQIRNQLF
jgi:hypothetical protein